MGVLVTIHGCDDTRRRMWEANSHRLLCTIVLLLFATAGEDGRWHDGRGCDAGQQLRRHPARRGMSTWRNLISSSVACGGVCL